MSPFKACTIISIVWLLMAGCQSIDAPHAADAWEVEEPAPAPTVDEEGRIIYAPDTLDWAKPGYRVIFHPRAISQRNKEEGVFDSAFPDWGEPKGSSSPNPEDFASGPHHVMVVRADPTNIIYDSDKYPEP